MTKQKQNNWKELVAGFVGNILAQLEDNVSQKMHAWFDNVKRKAVAGILAVLGLTYFLTGISDYANSMVGKNSPGLGYVIVGASVIFIGYLIGRDSKKVK